MSTNYFFVIAIVVKPNPANLTLKPIDANTIEVHFLIDPNLAYFPPGFSQLIRYKSDLDPDWISLNETDLNAETTDHQVILDNLFPYAEYTVELKYISRVVRIYFILIYVQNLFSVKTFSYLNIFGNHTKMILTVGPKNLQNNVKNNQKYTYTSSQIKKVLKTLTIKIVRLNLGSRQVRYVFDFETLSNSD